MSGDPSGLVGPLRVTALAAGGAGAVICLVGLAVAGPTAAALAAGGAGLGLINLWVAAGALRRLPALFIGTSLPRLALVTVFVLVLGLTLGPIAIWALLGLLGAHLVEVGAVLRYGLRQVAK